MMTAHAGTVYKLALAHYLSYYIGWETVLNASCSPLKQCKALEFGCFVMLVFIMTNNVGEYRYLRLLRWQQRHSCAFQSKQIYSFNLQLNKAHNAKVHRHNQ